MFIDKLESEFPLSLPLLLAISSLFLAMSSTKKYLINKENNSLYYIITGWVGFIFFSLWFGNSLLNVI